MVTVNGAKRYFSWNSPYSSDIPFNTAYSYPPSPYTHPHHPVPSDPAHPSTPFLTGRVALRCAAVCASNHTTPRAQI